MIQTSTKWHQNVPTSKAENHDSLKRLLCTPLFRPSRHEDPNACLTLNGSRGSKTLRWKSLRARPLNATALLPFSLTANSRSKACPNMLERFWSLMRAPLTAYLGIAAAHRSKLTACCWLGVTGSVGKSTTKEMLSHILTAANPGRKSTKRRATPDVPYLTNRSRSGDGICGAPRHSPGDEPLPRPEGDKHKSRRGEFPETAKPLDFRTPGRMWARICSNPRWRKSK